MTGDIVSPNWELELLDVTKNNVSKFTLVDHKRKVKIKKVKDIESDLKYGRHFENPLAVIRSGDKFKVTDGQHRLMAIQGYLSKNPDAIVVTPVMVFKSQQDSRKLYSLLSSGRPESKDDWLNAYVEVIPILKNIIQSKKLAFQVSVYKDHTTVQLRMLLRGYLSTPALIAQGGYSIGIENKEKNLRVFGDLNDNDFKRMINASEVYVEVFGQPVSGTTLYSPPFFIPCFRIILDNYERVGYDKLCKDLRGLVGIAHKILRVGKSGRLEYETAYKKMLRYLEEIDVGYVQ